jgi:antitoxin component YwqK of YwqJK toxin-antitoxin module
VNRLGRALLVVSLLASGCGTVIRTVCPEGTVARRRIFSGGAEAEWCHRDDGVHQGPEARYFESGAPMLEGAYVDGVRHGEWHYYTQVGYAWRRDRWEDGALLAAKVELPQRPPNGPPVDVLSPTESGVIKLASADPGRMRGAREDELETFAAWYGDGKPRVQGRYDGDGLRTREWRFWYEGGGPAREVTYVAGVRNGAFREWHPNGRPKTDGWYADGERDGRWRRWDGEGRPVADQIYGRGVMLPP